MSLHEFVSNQKRLLELELRAESENDQDDGRDGGFILRNIDVTDVSVGLYGRTVVQFGNTPSTSKSSDSIDDDAVKHVASQASSNLLPAHRLTVGDEVQILPNNGKGFQSGKQSRRTGGVICAVDDVSISVALFGGDAENRQKQSSAKKTGKKTNKEVGELNDDSEMLEGSPPYALVPKSNVEVHLKMVKALDELERHGFSHPIAGDVVASAFEPNNQNQNNNEMTRSQIDAFEEECDLASTRLDYSQREAVVMALYSKSPITLIHGPPGTGRQSSHLSY